MNTELPTELAQQAPEETSTSGRRPRPGVMLFALAFEALVVYWIVSSEIPGKVFISNWSLMLPGVFALALFALLRVVFPRFFSTDRMLLTYVCICAMGVLIGYGSLQLMFPAVSWMRFYTTTPGWAEIMKLLPSWVAPTDPATLKGFFYGDSTPNFAAWLPTIIAWCGLSMCFATVMVALSLLMSKSWIREERLTFPIVMLPLEMAREKSPLFRNGLFWVGFAIPAILESMIALNYYFPSIPALQLKHTEVASVYFVDRPWSAMYPCYVGFTPFIIGLAFLAPTDVAFSVFFFGLGDRFAQVYASYMGWDLPSAGSSMNQMPYLAQQNIGAFMAFGLFTLVRWYLRYRKCPRESWETMAWLTVALGVLAISIFFHVLGMSPLIAMAVVGMILMYAVALTRVRAESGVAWAFGPFGGTTSGFVANLGSGTFNDQTRAALGICQWYAADPRFLPMPFHMESLKIADSTGWSRPRMGWVLVAATLVGLALGSYFILNISHSLGISTAKMYFGITASARGEANLADAWFRNPLPLDSARLQWIGVGAAITIGLGLMRSYFLWWPFNPVGFVLAHTGTGVSFWGHYFIAWLLKVIVLRYGGMKMYQRVVPFVFGVIAGDILTITIWSLGAVIMGLPVYQFIS